MNQTQVDYWAWRTTASPQTIERTLKAIYGHTKHPVRFQTKDHGWKGFTDAAIVMHGDQNVGMVAWGGASQKGKAYVGLSGVGCAPVADWDLAQQAAEEAGGYALKRADLALDTFDGSRTFDGCLAAYRAGGFNLKGRPPKCEPMKPERPEDSAIIRIGSRTADKYFRGYEKGKQMLGPVVASAYVEGGMGVPVLTVSYADGTKKEACNLFDWWREELELKAQTGALPEDVIDRRDQYFAGAYPYLGTALQGVDPQAFVVPRVNQPALELSLALQNVRQQYGATLYTALTAYGGDIGAVWDRIIGRQHCQRLVEAGVLMVDHE